MKKSIRLLALLLAAVFAFSLAGCTGGTPNDDETSADISTTDGSDKTTVDETTEAPEPDKDLDVNVTVLSGTTGMGMAKLMSDHKAGNASLKYNFAVVSDATQIVAGIMGGSIDIAAAPTNIASTLYTKTNGKVYILSINTLGVLYVLEKGNTVTDIQSLKGKTIFVPGQGTNPEYILRYILNKNNITDVTFDYTYNTPDTLAQAVTAGLANIALLPEPKVTVVKNGNSEVRTALDLTAEWDKVAGKGSLAQGCVIVRKDFADSHPTEIKAFLKEYEESVNYVNENSAAAAELIAEAGIIPKAPLALAAIPNCNIKFVAGEDMKAALGEFYAALYSLNPQSIGGAVPNDDIYYIK